MIGTNQKTSVVNRRKHDRIPSCHETLVYNGEIFGQLIDICPDGLAFFYSKDSNRIKDMFLELDIMCKNRKLHIQRLFCKTISDFPIQDNTASSKQKIRRRCVKFSELSPEQEQLLHQFISSPAN